MGDQSSFQVERQYHFLIADRLLHGIVHPLTLPRAMPRTMCCWRKMWATTTGIIEIAVPARTGPWRTVYCLNAYFARPVVEGGHCRASPSGLRCDELTTNLSANREGPGNGFPGSSDRGSLRHPPRRLFAARRVSSRLVQPGAFAGSRLRRDVDETRSHGGEAG